MSRGGQAFWTGLGAALGLGLGLGISRWATKNMEDSTSRANIVLGASVGGAAVGGAVAAYSTSSKLLAA